MAATGVLPFIRGVDFSRNDFQDENCPKEMKDMRNVRWLKLNRTRMDWIPEELANLNKLETLSLVRNNLVTLHGELASLPNLRYLNCRHNNINNSGIPPELFQLDELLVLDFSHNQLKEVPNDLDKSKGILVLNLSHNNIQTIPNQLFINLTDLIFLDLSHNRLETLPPQMRRLVSLQTLVLSHNPLAHNQLRHLPSLTALKSLSLRDTERNLQNMPNSLDNLVNLSELDLSSNSLPRVPDAVFTLKSLKRLNLSDNCLTEIPQNIDEDWPQLEVLNLSRNKLNSLPNSLCKLTNLRRLFVNDNCLDFEGIRGIGRLYNLELFMAANNNLELIPEGVVRCGKLKKLILANNRLITLPDSIHLLTDLTVLDLSNNPDLIMPPKPSEIAKRLEFYNIDFSLNNQLRLAGAPTADGIGSTNTPIKDPIARKMRLVRRAREAKSSDSSKVLKGMTDLAKEKERLNAEAELNEQDLKPKRWDEALEKPSLDYSDYFEEDVGLTAGLTIWEIENFVPNRIDDALHGKFYEGDCYIILKTIIEDNQNVDWHIFYWIGAEAALDKKACSAIHAVNLRNYLGAHCRTIREEQAEESDAFLELFPDGILYVEGGRTASGFFTVEEAEVSNRMFKLHELSNKQIYMESVSLDCSALDPRFVFLVDTGYKIFIWSGKKSKNTMKQKARLLAEKINKEERKSKSELIFCTQGLEPTEFWLELNSGQPLDQPIEVIEHMDTDFKPYEPVVYRVGLGMGFLELPQVEYKPKSLTRKHFETKNVYIMDCCSELYVWIGRKSARLVRAAALKLAQELFTMVKRPDYAFVMRCLEGTETESFKSKFLSWDNVLEVDFTRTAESVQKTGADLTKWVTNQKTMKIDLSALFMPRQPLISKSEAQQMSEEWNEDLESMEAFVLENKKFVKLPEVEFGHFYSANCYVFLCRYWVPIESENASNEEEDDIEEDYHSMVYFWQGRDASNMGWLNFTFSLQKKFEAMYPNKLETMRTHQQQENLKFLSHFKHFIIHKGKRPNGGSNPYNSDEVEFFHLRSNCNPLTLRCIQITPTSTALNSAFCYILKPPLNEDGTGTAFVWIGSQADEDEAQVAEQIALQMYDSDFFTISIISEEEEPQVFWDYLGGRTQYERDASYIQYSRLFRCSNERGYFAISEKCSDFCQDDLMDEDIMLLDNGTQVFIWLGSRCSEVEVKLAYKSAQVYVQNMRMKQMDRPRTLMLTMKGKETRKFSKCFHAWSQHKCVSDPRLTLDKQMLAINYYNEKNNTINTTKE